MKIIYLFSFVVFAFCSNAFAEDKKATFPSDYFDDKANTTQKAPNASKSVENGKIGDKFLTKEQFDENYKTVERGNSSKLVQCPCQGKKKCPSQSCHMRTEIDDTGKVQYRFIPVPMESDEQVNPYFMMLSRQRLIANTTKEEKIPPVLIPEKKDSVQGSPEEKRVQVRSQLQQITRESRKNYRLYAGFSLGSVMTGSSNVKSTEQAGVYNSTYKTVDALGDEQTNYSLNKGYSGNSGYVSAFGGVELAAPLFSTIRFEMMSSAFMMKGSNSNIVNSRVANGNTANFSIGGEYGNYNMYQFGANIYFDLLRRDFSLYPSIGVGASIANINLTDGSGQKNFRSGILSMFYHLNIDLDDETTLFFGIRVSRMPSLKINGSYADRDLNASNTLLQNDRILSNKSIYFDQLTLTAAEIGFRFY